MLRSLTSLLPRFGARMASTMAVKPTVMCVPAFFQVKQNVQFMNQPAPSTNSFGIMQQVFEQIEPVNPDSATEMIMTSVLRKRRLKMKKHKLRKRRKAQRALRIKIGR